MFLKLQNMNKQYIQPTVQDNIRNKIKSTQPTLRKV